MVCPICHSRGWNFYLDESAGSYYCFADQHPTPSGGYLSDYGTKVRPKRVYATHEWKEIDVPGKALSENAIHYLQERDISYEDARRLGIVEGVGKYHGRCIIPFFTKAMRVCYFTARSYGVVSPGRNKYDHSGGTKPLYLPRLPLESGKEKVVFLVEGVFDAIAVLLAGAASAALCGQSITDAQLSMLIQEKPSEVIVLLDGGCELKAGKLVNRLFPYFEKTRLVQCPAKDPGEMTREDLRGFIEVCLSK